MVKNAQSSFFPKDWTPQQTVNAINGAYNNKIFIRVNRYIGVTSGGIEVEKFLDQSNNTISAYPIY